MESGNINNCHENSSVNQASGTSKKKYTFVDFSKKGFGRISDMSDNIVSHNAVAASGNICAVVNHENLVPPLQNTSAANEPEKCHVASMSPSATAKLQQAVIEGNLEGVVQSLKNKADPNTCVLWNGRYLVPVLVVATFKRNSDIVRALLKAQPRPADTEQRRDWTALTFAAQLGDDKIVRILLEHNAQTTTKERNGDLPIHFAAVGGHVEVAQLIQDSDKGRTLEAVGYHGAKPLHLAARYGQLDMVEWLVRRRVNINPVTRFGHTPLQLAAKKGKLKVLHYLVKHGANINHKNKKGLTAAQIAENKNHIECATYLRSLGDHNPTTLFQPIHAPNPYNSSTIQPNPEPIPSTPALAGVNPPDLTQSQFSHGSYLQGNAPVMTNQFQTSSISAKMANPLQAPSTSTAIDSNMPDGMDQLQWLHLPAPDSEPDIDILDIDEPKTSKVSSGKGKHSQGMANRNYIETTEAQAGPSLPATVLYGKGKEKGKRKRKCSQEMVNKNNRETTEAQEGPSFPAKVIKGKGSGRCPNKWQLFKKTKLSAMRERERSGERSEDADADVTSSSEDDELDYQQDMEEEKEEGMFSKPSKLDQIDRDMINNNREGKGKGSKGPKFNNMPPGQMGADPAEDDENVKHYSARRG